MGGGIPEFLKRHREHPSPAISCVGISNNIPIPKVWASMRRQSHFWKLCRGKILRQGKSVYTGSPKFKTTTLNQFWSAVLLLKLYSHGGFERDSCCTLQFPSTELFPLHNFQKWDCCCQWVYSFRIGEVWWMMSILGEWCTILKKTIIYFSTQTTKLIQIRMHLCEKTYVTTFENKNMVQLR